MIPILKKQGNTTVLMVHDKPFIMLAGEVHNSAASSAAHMETVVWPKVDELALNTLLVPVSWELVEPEEGVFDFSTVDSLIEQARIHGKKLCLLWFGAWKNAQCYYAPAWVKSDMTRFRRAEMQKGQRKLILTNFHRLPYTSLSAFCPATLEADSRAFAELMAHLRDIDGEENTVIAVQVENETGFMGAAREHSDKADAAFAQDVPAELIATLKAAPVTLAPDVRAAFEAGTGVGSWEQVFGPVAEELFTAWHTASYVQSVAAAGKAKYALPMAVNCWLDKGHKPGRFPSGGPVSRVMEVWRCAAPDIDIIGPDIYVPYFCDVCDSYVKLNNPLFIPEAASHGYAAVRELYTFGHYHGMCYSPFGIEELGDPFDDSIGMLFGMDTSDPALRTPQDPVEYTMLNKALAGLLPVMAPRFGSDAVQAVTCERPNQNLLSFGRSGFEISTQKGIPGGCLGVQVSENEFWLLALHCTLTPVSLDESAPHVDLLVLDEGVFDDNGAWQPGRRLNGDEATIQRYGAPTLLHVKTLVFG